MNKRYTDLFQKSFLELICYSNRVDVQNSWVILKQIKCRFLTGTISSAYLFHFHIIHSLCQFTVFAHKRLNVFSVEVLSALSFVSCMYNSQVFKYMHNVTGIWTLWHGLIETTISFFDVFICIIILADYRLALETHWSKGRLQNSTAGQPAVKTGYRRLKYGNPNRSMLIQSEWWADGPVGSVPLGGSISCHAKTNKQTLQQTNKQSNK